MSCDICVYAGEFRWAVYTVCIDLRTYVGHLSPECSRFEEEFNAALREPLRLILRATECLTAVDIILT